MSTATAATTQAAPAPKTVKCFFVLTLQFSLGGMSHFIAENSGDIEVPEGFSRTEAFRQLRQNMIDAARQQGHTIYGEPTTVFFSLERDAL
ncbi:hypothetical protein SUDANB121_05970 (plasmid) [Nocardiopsis dassonvillei]|uniref:hypothetical protein n=1 Tax=Nocardiopsis dassonvillei TaxID=2014 RepID=UPI003F576A7F